MKTNAFPAPSAATLEAARMIPQAGGRSLPFAGCISLSAALALALAGTAPAAAPPNDNFADAIELAGDSGNLSGNHNIDATLEAGEQDCVYPGTTNTVWFKWTCTTAGSWTLDTTGSVNQGAGEWDACVAVYTGAALATLGKVVEKDVDVAESITLPVTPGVYYIQLGGYPFPGPPDAATDINLTWTWSEGPAPGDISNDIGPLIDGGLHIDNVVGTGNSGRLVGDVTTYWASNGFTVDLDLNGFTLEVNSGGGNEPFRARGAVSGDGALVFDTVWDKRISVDGTAANSNTGTTLVRRGWVHLDKPTGLDALRGTITVGGTDRARLVWAAGDQVNDASDLSLATSGSQLDLAGFSEQINDLYLIAGTSVQTGSGGVLKVARLYLDGELQPEVAKTSGDGFVLGSGYIEVGASGPPVIVDPPAEPLNPTPADLAADVHPATFHTLDWDDSVGATGYDLYLWLDSETKPLAPTATVSLSDYPLPADLLSQSTYHWQVVAQNSVGDTPGDEWSFDTMARWELEGSLTDALDAIVGEGNSGRLVGDATTMWFSTTSVSDVDLNGFTLTLHNGGGNAQTYNGAITGPGTLRLDARYAADWSPDVRLGGTLANSPGSVFLNAGRFTLNKTAGVDALAGPVTMSGSGSTKRIWLENSDQINDASTIDSTASSGLFELVLNGFSETIAGLDINTGDLVSTGEGGVLTVGSLSVGGTVMGPGTYTEAGNPEFVSGSGSVVVSGGGGGAFDSWATAKGLAGGDAGFTADPDGDGIDNGIEFVIGGEPNPAHPDWNSRNLLPAGEVSGDYFVFSYTVMNEAAYLDPLVEFDSDLQDPWTTAVDPDNATIVVTPGDPAATVTVTIPKAGNREMFARLRVIEP